MIYHHKRDLSLPHKNLGRELLEEVKKSPLGHSLMSSRVEPHQHMLRYDINMLLSLFNEMQEHGSGEVSRKGISRVLQTIGLHNYEPNLKDDYYTFDHFLSIIGQIEVPNQPSVYVLSFVKILVHYRDRSLQNQEQGLEEAQAVQEKIRTISRNQLDRQKERINQEHSKIYEEMQRSQEKQFYSFQQEWKIYLKEFKEQTMKRLDDTKYQKKSKLADQENKFLSKVRRHSVVTSPWLRQLTQKKKWLIHEKKFQQAIQVSHQINRERMKLSEYKEQSNQTVLNKKLAKLTTQTNRYLGTVQKNLEMDFNRLISKKKQGQTIMRIRMKKLREQANRKLNDHYRTQISRLRSSFYMAVNH